MEKAVVFGCGYSAVQYREELHKNYKVIAYSCNQSEKWGQIFDGVNIIEPVQIPEDAVIIVASEAYYAEILYGLVLQGVIKQDRVAPVYAVLCGTFVQCFPTVSPTSGWRYEYPSQEPMPVTLNAGLSGLCNSKCQYCGYHSEYSDKKYFPQSFMNEETLGELIRQIEPIHSLKILKLYGSGEAMLHPDWGNYASRLLSFGSFDTCLISTNGMLLTKENVVEIMDLPVERIALNISVDGFSPEDCEYWRKGEKFSVIQKNINRAYEILGQRAEMTITSCVVLPSSVRVDLHEEVARVLKESETWKKEEFPFAKVSTGLALPNADNIPGTKVVEAAILPKAIDCSIPFRDIMVNSGGDILACVCGHDLYLNMKGASIGNVKKDNILDVFYHNDVLKQIRKDFLSGKNPKICGTCTQCSRNSILCLQRTE